jgi:hypothetical protein
MHKLTLNIQEVMVFSNWLSAKQNLHNALESVLYNSIWTLEKNTSLAPKFLYICTHVANVIRNNVYFRSLV